MVGLALSSKNRHYALAEFPDSNLGLAIAMSQINREDNAPQPTPGPKRSLRKLIWDPLGGELGTKEAQQLALFVYRGVVISWLAVCFIWVVHSVLNYKYKFDPAIAGQFGDTFGSINALFSGLAFVGVAYAIALQHKELEDTKRKSELEEKEKIQRSRAERMEKFERLRTEERSLKHQAEHAMLVLMTARLNSSSTLVTCRTQMLASVTGIASDKSQCEVMLQLSQARLKITEYELNARRKFMDENLINPLAVLADYFRPSHRVLKVSWDAYMHTESYPFGFSEYVALFYDTYQLITSYSETLPPSIFDREYLNLLFSNNTELEILTYIGMDTQEIDEQLRNEMGDELKIEMTYDQLKEESDNIKQNAVQTVTNSLKHLYIVANKILVKSLG